VPADAARSHDVPADTKMFNDETEELEIIQALSTFLGQCMSTRVRQGMVR
jgi:hypothetical protein